MKNFGKQQKQFTQFYQGTGFGKQTTVGFYTQKFHNSLLDRLVFRHTTDVKICV